MPSVSCSYVNLPSKLLYKNCDAVTVTLECNDIFNRSVIFSLYNYEFRIATGIVIKPDHVAFMVNFVMYFSFFWVVLNFWR